MVEAGLDLGGVGGLLVAGGGELGEPVGGRGLLAPRRAATASSASWRCTSRSSSAAVSRSSRSASLVFWISSRARFSAASPGSSESRAARASSDGGCTKASTANSRISSRSTVDLGGLGLDGGGGLGEGGLGLARRPAGLGEQRLLAGHVGGRGRRGPPRPGRRWPGGRRPGWRPAPAGPAPAPARTRDRRSGAAPSRRSGPRRGPAPARTLRAVTRRSQGRLADVHEPHRWSDAANNRHMVPGSHTAHKPHRSHIAFARPIARWADMEL